MPRILVVYHSQSGNTKSLAEAVAEGATQVEGTQATVKDGLKAGVDDMLACDAIAIGTPDYFSYMAGGLKDFFDRVYFPTKEKVAGRPFVAFVSHGGGGKAVESVERIARSFKFQKAAEPLMVQGKPDAQALDAARKLGRSLAEVVAS